MASRRNRRRRRRRTAAVHAAQNRVRQMGGTPAQVALAGHLVYKDHKKRSAPMYKRKLAANMARHGSTIAQGGALLGTMVAAVYPPVGGAIIAASAAAAAVSAKQEADAAKKKQEEMLLQSMLNPKPVISIAGDADGNVQGDPAIQAAELALKKAKARPASRQMIGMLYSKVQALKERAKRKQTATGKVPVGKQKPEAPPGLVTRFARWLGGESPGAPENQLGIVARLRAYLVG